MAHNRFEWLNRIKSVDREHAAMSQAAARLLADARRDPKILRSNLQLRDAQNAAARLEGTYVMRLFAGFETGLRSYWKTIRRKRTGTEHLIESIAALHDVPDATRIGVQQVRDYRNSLVHERDQEAMPIPILSPRRHICTFFVRLPVNW